MPLMLPIAVKMEMEMSSKRRAKKTFPPKLLSCYFFHCHFQHKRNAQEEEQKLTTF